MHSIDSHRPLILVVDDAPDSIEPIVNCLHKADFRTRIATRGERALQLAASTPVPDLILVVVDNNGGGIFGSLEQAAPDFEDVYERVFGTPVDVDLGALIVAHGVPVFDSLTDALGGSGIRAIVIGPVDRSVEAQIHRDLGEALA